MFVLQRGSYHATKMDYSYSRRAQSVIETLHWKDVATIDTESVETAITEAKSAIREWEQKGFTSERWRVEGRGKQINQCHEIVWRDSLTANSEGHSDTLNNK